MKIYFFLYLILLLKKIMAELFKKHGVFANELIKEYCYIKTEYLNKSTMLMDLISTIEAEFNLIDQCVQEYKNDVAENPEEIQEKQEDNNKYPEIENDLVFDKFSETGFKIQKILVGLYPKFIDGDGDRTLSLSSYDLDLEIQEYIKNYYCKQRGYTSK